MEIILIIVLLMDILFAFLFANTAKMKGHSYGLYLALSLCFPLFGNVLVAALPDLYARSGENNSQLRNGDYAVNNTYTVQNNANIPMNIPKRGKNNEN